MWVARVSSYQIVVVDLGVEALGGVAAIRSRDEGNALAVVIRSHAAHSLPLGHNQQVAAQDVELGIHGARHFASACEREPQVAAVAHPIDCKGLENALAHKFARRHVDKGQGPGRVLQPLQMLVQLKHPAVVDAQALPHRVAALHSAVEDAYFGQVSRHESVAHPHQDLCVSVVRQRRRGGAGSPEGE